MGVGVEGGGGEVREARPVPWEALRALSRRVTWVLSPQGEETGQRHQAWSRENSEGPMDGVRASVQVPVPRFTHLRRLLNATRG